MFCFVFYKFTEFKKGIFKIIFHYFRDFIKITNRVINFTFFFLQNSNMMSFKRFAYTPLVKYKFIAWAAPIVLPRLMLFMNEVPYVIEQWIKNISLLLENTQLWNQNALKQTKLKCGFKQSNQNFTKRTKSCRS